LAVEVILLRQIQMNLRPPAKAIARKSAVLKRKSAKMNAIPVTQFAMTSADSSKNSVSGIASHAVPHLTRRAPQKKVAQRVEDVFTRAQIRRPRVTKSRRIATNLPLEIPNAEILAAELTAKKRPKGVCPSVTSTTNHANRCAIWRTRCAR